jgi:hypothetical protein
MRFNDLIATKFGNLLEQTPVQPEINVPAAEAPVAAPQAVPTAQVEPQQQKPLTPEGEVFIINLLRKALFMNPGDVELKVLKDLPDTDEKNASDILNKIIKIMQIDAVNIDVDKT